MSYTMDVKPREVRMQMGVRIPTRDGVRLSAILYLPRDLPTPQPTIVTITPYIAQVHHEQGVFFASHGYPYLSVDLRGRGDSEGQFRADARESEDAADVVEWVATQPYCDSKVTMWGGSYSGYLQWAAAKHSPEHLATIVPVAPPFRGVDSPMRNNIFNTYRIQWLTYLTGHAAHDRIFADHAFWRSQFRGWLESGTPFRDLDRYVGNPSPIFQEWVSHPTRDGYWDDFNPRPDEYARLAMPILTITGHYDGNQLGALEHYRQHMRSATTEARLRHYLIIGPWDHAGTRVPKQEFCGLEVGAASLVDLPQLHLDWYAWTLKGGPKPTFLERNIAYYVTGAEKWRYADSLEAVTEHEMPLYLAAGRNPTDVLGSGALQTEPAVAAVEPHRYVYDPRDSSLAHLEGDVDPESRVDQRMLFASVGRRLVYHSPPFERDTEIAGFFRFCAWISIDQPDTDFQVTVYEVAVDGTSTELATDCLRARYRESLRAQKLVETTEPIRYQFERFTFIARLVRRRSRLRLVLGPINSIYMQKNYNSGGIVSEESIKDSRTVTVKLYTGASWPSVLHVPLGQPEA